MPRYERFGLWALLLGFLLLGGCTRCQDETPVPPPDAPPPSLQKPDSPPPPPEPVDEGPSSLEESLMIHRREQEAGADPELLTAYTLGIEEITASGVLKDALNVGDKAADFSLTDHKGESFRLSDALKDGTLVLLWYQGDWSGYCRRTLTAFQGYLMDYRYHGGRLVAISPDPPEITKETAEKLDLEFPLLSDPEHRAARAFRVLAPLPDSIRERWEAPEPPDERPDPIPEALPLAAVYVVGEDGVIHHAVLNADWRLRGDPAVVMEIVFRLSKPKAPGCCP